jgi:hypothetical protein
LYNYMMTFLSVTCICLFALFFREWANLSKSKSLPFIDTGISWYLELKFKKKTQILRKFWKK